MNSRSNKRLAAAAAAITLVGLSAQAAQAQTASATTFATGAAQGAGISGPDSITTGAGSVWVSYSGGPGITADGSPSADSTVVRYDQSGRVQARFKINGSVDGLKYNPNDGTIWALQNQDANSHLTIIDPRTNLTTPLNYLGQSPSQGVDDVAFAKSGTYLSFTNAALPSDATLLKITGGNPGVGSTAPIATTTILTAGATPNITPDTDSLKVAPNGDLVQTSGTRNTLLFVHNPGDPSQSVRSLTLIDPSTGLPFTKGLDDSLYVTASTAEVFLTETGSANTVLDVKLTGLVAGDLIASLGGELALIDQTTGVATPLLTGLSGPHGLADAQFVNDVPEPAALSLFGLGLAGLAGLRRRRA